MSKQQQLDELQTKIIQNNVCLKLAEQATQIVFGSGNPDADIVFIGEAPGKNEDFEGLPFVGAAGKFLNAMLQSIGLDRSDVYITNIVKYRPPNNRDPLPKEKQEFLPYLMEQLKIIGPKLVVTLGRHSMESFLPEAKISQVHGQPTSVSAEHVGFISGQSKLLVLPLYHPAAALYNGGLRQTLIEDFSKIPQIIKENS